MSGLERVEADLAARYEEHLADLKAFCAIPSVSTQPAHRADVARAAEFVVARLVRAGLEGVAVRPTAGHPVVTAGWTHAPGAPTVLVYGHYDVQPPEPLEKWTTPPFEPAVRQDRLYARGVSDDKGPMLIPILVAEAFLRTTGKLPVNLKILIEGEEECGSANLEDAVRRHRDLLAADLVLSADGAMWRPDRPSVIVASRGLAALEVRLRGAARDLHSGRHGGSAPNPIAGLARLLASLHDEEGRVAVAGFHDGIRPPDPAILEAIEAAAFDPAHYFTEIGALSPPDLAGPDLLRRQWLEPTLELNGIGGGYGGPGTKTVIPAEASAKITCRLVAGQDPGAVSRAIEVHLVARCPPGMRLSVTRQGAGSAAFALSPDTPALAVVEDVLAGLHGIRPLRVAMGATIPIGGIFRRALGIETVFFSFSTSDEDYHAPDEFFRLASFRQGLIGWARALEALGVD